MPSDLLTIDNCNESELRRRYEEEHEHDHNQKTPENIYDETCGVTEFIKGMRDNGYDDDEIEEHIKLYFDYEYLIGAIMELSQ